MQTLMMASTRPKTALEEMTPWPVRPTHSCTRPYRSQEYFHQSRVRLQSTTGQPHIPRFLPELLPHGWPDIVLGRLLQHHRDIPPLGVHVGHKSVRTAAQLSTNSSRPYFWVS